MLYMTRYHLGWDKATGPNTDEVTQELHQNIREGKEDNMEHHSRGYWETIIQGDLNASWYDHQMDVATILSKKWPEIRFGLYGHGDDECDIWAEYFLNGTVHRVQGETKYPEFNPEQLVNPQLPAE